MQSIAPQFTMLSCWLKFQALYNGYTIIWNIIFFFFTFLLYVFWRNHCTSPESPPPLAPNIFRNVSMFYLTILLIYCPDVKKTVRKLAAELGTKVQNLDLFTSDMEKKISGLLTSINNALDLVLPLEQPRWLVGIGKYFFKELKVVLNPLIPTVWFMIRLVDYRNIYFFNSKN